ncbi:hypothetical protein ScPMuIL_015842 [Solemya velum]
MAIFKVPFLTGVRRLLYILTPNESSFHFENEVPEYLKEAVPFFFVFIILEIIISFLKGDGKVRLNDGVTSISAGIFSKVPDLLTKSILYCSYLWVYENFRILELSWNSPWTWWFCLLGVDCGYYWFHRFAHEVNFMWAAHSVHHSSEEYNLTTALRQSVLQLYTSWMFYIPLALFVPFTIFMVHCDMNTIYQFWIHTKYIKTLGPLEYIMNTPSHHRVHHGRNPYCIDKNYGGTLIIWDRLFGTFAAESEEVAFGLTHPLNTFEPVQVQFGYVKYMFRRLSSLSGWKNKVASMFCGPGWAPGKPRLGNIEDIPKVQPPFQLYDTKTPLWMNIYVAVHFPLTVVGFQIIHQTANMLSAVHVLLYSGFLLLSLTSFGLMFDKRPLSPFLELIRCAGFIFGELLLRDNEYGSSESSTTVNVIRVMYLASLGIWSMQSVRAMASTMPKQMKQE